MPTTEEFINQNWAALLTDFRRFIALGGVAKTGEDIRASANFIREMLVKWLGAEVRVIETAGSPVVTATLQGQSDQAVLFYGHYDVMDAGNLDLWTTPPFELSIRDDRMYGRGTGDNKGQLLAQIFGMASFLNQHQTLPFTVKLLIDGEEENGSPHLGENVSQLANSFLKQVGTVIVIDGSMNQANEHVLRLGNRGVMGCEMMVQTGNENLHSGNFGNIMTNAPLFLMAMIHRIYDFETQRVRIPGFYSQVTKPDATQQVWLAKLPYDRLRLQTETGLSNLPSDGSTYYRRLMFEPTFNIEGMTSGYTSTGTKTIIPASATAKLEWRLVVGQSQQKIQSEIERLFETEVADGKVHLKFTHGANPTLTDDTLPQIPAILAAIQAATGKALIEPVMPGTVPNDVWVENLHVPVFTIPYANFDQHNHAPNENLSIAAFRNGINISNQLMSHLKEII